MYFLAVSHAQSQIVNETATKSTLTEACRRGTAPPGPAGSTDRNCWRHHVRAPLPLSGRTRRTTRWPQERPTRSRSLSFFFFQAEDGIRDLTVTGVQTCALPISAARHPAEGGRLRHHAQPG